MALPTPRTNAANVALLIDVDSTIDLTAFMQTANMVVTKWCGSLDYNDDQLEMIERWLSAHFYATRDKQATSEHAGSVGIAYQGKTALFLKATTYGQQAMSADYLGGLAAFQKRLETGLTPSPGIRWLGSNCPTDTSYPC